MKLVTYTAVVVLAMATAAFADSGSSTPTPLTPGNGPSMQKSAAPAAAPRHSSMTSNARREDQAENPITAQLNEQQLKNSGTAPMQYSAGPQGTGTLSNPNNCSPGMNGCAPDSAGPAKSNDADSPR
jgi:hypothetical protein